MAMLENCSESTISREIKKIKKKIKKVIWILSFFMVQLYCSNSKESIYMWVLELFER
jgi:hypothetical protein